MFFGNSFVKLAKKRPRLSIFAYRIVYSDLRNASRKSGVVYSKTLRSERYGITGKPDYIFKNVFINRYIPVELKSGSIKDAREPHLGDLMQLAAYFVILEEHYKVKPRQGRLIYNDAMFVVKNTKRLKKLLLKTVEDMRAMLLTGEGTANNSFVSCRFCMCNKTVCEFCKAFV